MRQLENAFLKLGLASIWIPKSLEGDPNLKYLIDPDSLFSDPRCEIVKDQRKIKVGRMVLEIGGKPRRVYMKRYNAFSIRYRLFSVFLESPAARAWRGAEMLARAGFRTGRPIAAMEWRYWGMLTKSFYLSEEIPGGKTVDAYWREELMPLNGRLGQLRRRSFLHGLASLFRGLHAACLYHNDLKDANIIVGRESGPVVESFHLLDLEGLRSCSSVNRRRRMKNLVQLHRTMGKFLRRPDKVYWLKVYLGKDFFDRKEKRKWIGKILTQSAIRDWRAQMRKQSSSADLERRTT